MDFLFIVDVFPTLGIATGEGRTTTDVLAALSPLPRELVAHTVYRILHRTPDLTDEVIREICADLLIDPEQWPDPWPTSGFEPYEFTAGCLAALSFTAPVVALTNLSVTGADRIQSLKQQCGNYLTRVYTSYELKACKPSRWLWLSIADDQKVKRSNVVHIGDRWPEDVLGPINAGCRAIWTRLRRDEQPAERPAGPDRLAIVDHLPQAVEVALEWVNA